VKEILKQVIFEQQEELQKPYITRKFPKSLNTCREIIIISGIRRCGKSVLLHQIRNANKERDYYINFDDERLMHFSSNDFQKLHELFIELFGVQKTFYFDEIQNIDGWERFVRRLYDSGCKVYVTGSNATMLSRELGSRLTGRYIEYELFPFSFREYLGFNRIKIGTKDMITTQGRAKLSRAFGAYFKEGGFPQYLENKNKDYLKSLYESILYRDVMIRNKLTNENEVMSLVHYLATNVSRLASYNSLSATTGVKSSTTIKNYVDYIEDTYLLFQINKFDYSLRKQIQNPKKFFFIDNALVGRLGFSFSDNYGRLLENLVFITLRRLKRDIFYHNGNFECDFVIRHNKKITEAIQVCYNMETQEIQKRELQGISEAMNTYNLKTGTIITMNEEREIKQNNTTIKIIPAWKWIMNSEEEI
jgi:hypothetical protein